MTLSALKLFQEMYSKEASIFKKNFDAVYAEFGEDWETEFNAHLEKLFENDEEAYRNAIRGYTKFAIDAMRLQRLFNKKRQYEDVSYEEACEKVYLNEDYMLHLYLPGIFVSHFLWRHHYKQFLYYKERFLPLLNENEEKRFYDVGTGTGFYTVQMFRYDPGCQGYGIDISPYARKFTTQNIVAWGFEYAFTALNLNIIEAELEPLPFIQCVEVLEHLSDPQLFLHHLRKLLKKGGYGFITAALTAPNADHIYLYWQPDDVIKQLVAAGFEVQDYTEERAYEGQPEEYVPKVAAFIITS